VAVLFIFVLFTPQNGISGDTVLTPSIGLSETYSDNVFYGRTDIKDDFITIISPAIKFDYATEITKIRTGIDSDFIFYTDNKDLNNQKYDGGINFSSRYRERFLFNADASYKLDSTLESELAETGRVTSREDRHRRYLGAGLGINLTELTALRISYRYRKTDYDSNRHVDYNTDDVYMDLSKRLDNQLDTLTLRTGYTLRQSSESESDNYSANFGWTRNFSKTHRLRVFAGYRYSHQLEKSRETNDSQGGLFDIGYTKSGLTYSLNIGYRRDFTFTADGEDVEVDRIYYQFSKNLSERSRVGLGGTFSNTGGLYNTLQDDTQYLHIRPYFGYNLTERHRMALNYEYSAQYDDSLAENKTVQRNRIWIQFSFNFPKRW
jgi:hypothetical protein